MCFSSPVFFSEVHLLSESTVTMCFSLSLFPVHVSPLVRPCFLSLPNTFVPAGALSFRPWFIPAGALSFRPWFTAPPPAGRQPRCIFHVPLSFRPWFIPAGVLSFRPWYIAHPPAAHFLSAFLYAACASCSIVFSSRFLHSVHRIAMVLLLFCFVSYISVCASPRPPPFFISHHGSVDPSPLTCPYISLSVLGFFVVGFNDPLVELLPRTQISTTRQHMCFG